LSSYRFGVGDPTTRLTPGEFWRATYTPQGPATLHLDWRGDDLRAHAWGPGSDWLLDSVAALTGAFDPGHVFLAGHPRILAAQRDHPSLKFGASGTLYHELLPTILGQRITAGEAIRQWHTLVYRLGAVAPGPLPGLRLPPAASDLAQRPAWWFHPLGIEARRANALRQVARHADRLHEWALLAPSAAAAKLGVLPGIGQWTIGSVLATAMGDPDALAVGDYHLKNVIVHALTGRPRGTDEEMLALLAPYAGQRGRAARLLLLAGHRPPKFGPRQRVLPMSRW
jgi:3-methyladenine DNA glycosylase/8-oxoguanine DNA glycosylase